MRLKDSDKAFKVLWMVMKASSGDLEHTGAGLAGRFGRLVGVGDGVAG